MKTIKKIIGLLLYNLIAKHLPVSHSLIRIGQKSFRAFCGKLILNKCGKNINIEKDSVFSSKVELGDNSEIGVGCQINGKCIIGKDVPEWSVVAGNPATVKKFRK